MSFEVLHWITLGGQSSDDSAEQSSPQQKMTFTASPV
jgi:hypothetical protein